MLIINPTIKEKLQELKHLEKKYQGLIYKRDEILVNVEEFNNEYNLKFSILLNQILNLKEENIYKKIEVRKLKKEKLLKNDKVLEILIRNQNKLQIKLDKIKHEIKFKGSSDKLNMEKKELEIALDEVSSQINFINIEKDRFKKEIENKDDEIFENELNETKNDKKEFNEELNESEKVEKLNTDDKKELKILYRKVSKLVHPDVVIDKYKDDAIKLMSKLNEFYRLNQLDKIKEMFLQIENKNFIFVSDSLNEEEIIQKHIYKMKDKIVEVLTEIDELKENEIFQIIENKDEYFKEVEENLNQRLNDLKSEKSYLDINIMKYQDF